MIICDEVIPSTMAVRPSDREVIDIDDLSRYEADIRDLGITLNRTSDAFGVTRAEKLGHITLFG